MCLHHIGDSAVAGIETKRLQTQGVCGRLDPTRRQQHRLTAQQSLGIERLHFAPHLVDGRLIGSFGGFGLALCSGGAHACLSAVKAGEGHPQQRRAVPEIGAGGAHPGWPQGGIPDTLGPVQRIDQGNGGPIHRQINLSLGPVDLDRCQLLLQNLAIRHRGGEGGLQAVAPGPDGRQGHRWIDRHSIGHRQLFRQFSLGHLLILLGINQVDLVCFQDGLLFC